MQEFKKIKAFVAHSFDNKDERLILKFLKFFSSMKNILEWEHAEDSQPKGISKKVKEIMLNKKLFIGIFTSKHSMGLLKKEYLPSLWIAQESGYALGKEMKLIFLVEDNLKEDCISGLHADHELIFFSRKNPEKSFSKINFMIFEVFKTLSKTEIISESKKEEINLKSEYKKEESEVNFIINLREAVNSGNSEKEKEAYNKLIENNSADKKIENENWYLFLKAQKGDKESLKKIKEFSEKEEYYPNFYLGLFNASLSNFPEAIKCFSAAFNYAKKSGNFKNMSNAIIKKSKCLLKEGKIEEAYNSITSEILSDKATDEQLAHIYESLGKIAKLNKDDDLFLSFSEKSLKCNPLNSNLRFNVAYEYSKQRKENMSLYHYEILYRESPSGVICNNIGAAYSNLKLFGLSIKFYREAIQKYNETLSMSNLANVCIEAGLLDQAEELLNNAKKNKDYHSNVNDSISTLKEKKNQESKKAAEISDTINQEKEFRTEYAFKFTQPFENKETIEGGWKTPLGLIKFTVKNSVLEGVGKFSESFSWAKLYGQNIKNEFNKNAVLKGEIKGKTAKYNLVVGSSIPGEKTQLYSGLMLFYPDTPKIKIFEKNEEEKAKVYSITKLP